MKETLYVYTIPVLTDNNNVYGENAGKKVTEKKSHI
jgi:hypothetical protein